MKEKMLTKKGLNANQLKIIAIIAMTIDHITQVFLIKNTAIPTYLTLRVIGKITIPIMWFFIAEGYYHTKNIKKYIGRLFVFSIISHFAYCYAFNVNIIPTNIFFETSVMWSLLWGLIALCIAKNEKINIWIKMLLIFLIVFLVYNADWGFISILAIIFLGLTRDNRIKQMAGMTVLVIVCEIAKFSLNKNYYQFMHLGILLSIPFLILYNGEKGKCKWLKWFFYIYYPLHLIIIAIVKNIVLG